MLRITTKACGERMFDILTLRAKHGAILGCGFDGWSGGNGRGFVF